MNILAVCEQTQTSSAPVQLQPQEKQAHVIQFRLPEEKKHERQCRQLPIHAVPIIKVFAVGGGGSNALNRVIEKNLDGVEFIAVNTDIQHLYNKSKAKIKLQIGKKTTGGWGAGGEPEKGMEAAEEDKQEVIDNLQGANMAFIMAGMGGGTGTGAAPVIAKLAKEMGILTVAVVTTPFDYEGRYKMQRAIEGIKKLRENVDSLIIIPNQHLYKVLDNKLILDDAYSKVDDVLCQAVQGISELVTETGIQNIDFADVKKVMKGQGDALMGMGTGSGESRAIDAVKNAIDNPILEDSDITGATGVLVNITCPYGEKDITLIEKKTILEYIQTKCHDDVILKFGIIRDSDLDNTIKVTIVATGFKRRNYVVETQVEPPKQQTQDVIIADDFDKIKSRTIRAEGLQYLKPKDYQNDLDFPSYLRYNKYNNNTQDGDQGAGE